MRHKINILLFILCLTFIFTLSASAQDFTIDDFNVNIVFNKDSSFTVKETISVDFHLPRHGIYREIPFIYTDTLGKNFRTPTEILSVTDGSGNKLNAKTEHAGNIIKIRIGDPDITVTGRQKYELFYRVENAIMFFDDHDELYWNVTGNYWKAMIKNAKCTVSLADGLKSANYWASCFTGITGSTETECRYKTSDYVTEFSTNRSLSAGEGLTVAYGWNKGIILPPSSFQKLLWLINLEQNWIFVFPFLSLLIMFSLWNTRGRDPKSRESVAVMYEPPKHKNKALDPGEVGALIDESFDPKDITATIVGLAVKGFIKIEETKKEGLIFDSKDYYIAKVKEPDESLSAFEKELMTDIFGGLPGKMVSEMKNSFYVHINNLKKTLYGELVNKNYFSVNPDNVRKIYAVAGVIVSIASIFLLNLSFGSVAGSARVILAGILTGLPVLSFSKYMPAKTKTGSAVYMDILGFQEFLRRAEKDHLERMKDENLFSKFFPYALALDVADNWAKAFEGIYQKPPEWYTSPAGRTFSPTGFNHSINSAMSSLSSAMFSAPRGSGTGGSGGFGGGGSSGGGFGGGGGGSW